MGIQGGTFNLVDEPWIVTLDERGARETLGLADVFRRAPELGQVVGEVPTQGFAILRLLLAILHRATGGPRDTAAWRAVRDDWERAAGVACAYLEQFRDRFDLRHPERPFFQVADLRTTKGEHSGLEKLIADVPNGHPYFTTRIGRGIERIDWAESARWLVHAQAFDPSGIRSGAVGDPRVKGGKGYPIGPAWTGQIGGIHLVGRSLAETLALNLVVPADVDIASGPEDLPVWEREPLGPGPDESNHGEPRGLVDLYTWQARRIRLFGDADGVSGVLIAQGDRATPQNRHPLEAMTTWRFSTPQTKKLGRTTYMPRTHDPQRQFWRGLESLLPGPGKGDPPQSLEPGVLRWVARLRQLDEIGPGVTRLRATGVEYGPNSSTFAEIVDDELILPVDVLADEALGQVAVDAVDAAERAVQALVQLARNVARAGGASTEDDGPGQSVREQAYAALDVEFRSWLTELLSPADRQDRLVAWQRAVNEIIFRMSRDVVTGASTAAWTGRVVQGRHVDLGRADSWFLRDLARALPLARQEQAEEKEAKV